MWHGTPILREIQRRQDVQNEALDQMVRRLLTQGGWLTVEKLRNSGVNDGSAAASAPINLHIKDARIAFSVETNDNESRSHLSSELMVNPQK